MHIKQTGLKADPVFLGIKVDCNRAWPMRSPSVLMNRFERADSDTWTASKVGTSFRYVLLAKYDWMSTLSSECHIELSR
jgi:hypothetical protein